MTITKISQVTPVWLSTVLKEQGLMKQGKVETVSHELVSTPASEAYRLHLTFSADTEKEVPHTLFLKISSRIGEINFYRKIGWKTPEAPLIKALAADYSGDARKGYLLFKDYTDTHFELEDGGMPSEETVREIVSGLAGIHAYWWDHVDLGMDILEINEDVYHFIYNVAVEAWPKFSELMAEEMNAGQKEAYQQLLSAWPFPALAQRLSSGRHLTIVHSDTHFYNMLYPKDPAENGVLLIDWAVWHINLGVSDMAYQLVFSPPEWRAKYEKPILEHYHSELIRQGVEDYSWEELWEDYRLSVVGLLLWTPFWWAFDLAEDSWQQNFTAGLRAYEDLGLGELLK